MELIKTATATHANVVRVRCSCVMHKYSKRPLLGSGHIHWVEFAEYHPTPVSVKPIEVKRTERNKQNMAKRRLTFVYFHIDNGRMNATYHFNFTTTSERTKCAYCANWNRSCHWMFDHIRNDMWTKRTIGYESCLINLLSVNLRRLLISPISATILKRLYVTESSKLHQR